MAAFRNPLAIDTPYRAAALSAALCCIPAMSAHADVIATLEFIQPTGSVGPYDSIDVWVKLTVDPASEAIVFDAENGILLNDSLLPEMSDIVSYDAHSSYTSVSYYCEGNFWPDCASGGSYTFQWNYGAPGKPSFIGLSSLNLQPGDSMTYVFGTFVPGAGGAEPGTYSFAQTSAAVWLYDADDAEINYLADLATTCPDGGACGFTRTVTAVPEPSAYALMGVGTLLVGWAARRRRTR